MTPEQHHAATQRPCRRQHQLSDHTPGLLKAWWQTLKAVFGDKGVALLLIGAPILYGFFYPWFYGKEVAQRVPVAVVVHESGSLARQMVRYADASPRIAVALVTGDEREARQSVLRGDTFGYAVIPADLKRSVVRSAEVVVPVYAHGGYPLVSRQVQFGFAEAFGTVSAGVELRRLQAGGQSALQAQASRAPLDVGLVALFNPTEGYGSFVVAAVALLILQQTLLMGVAMLVATWREQGLARASGVVWAARLTAFCVPGWLAGVYYFGWVFVWHGYPSGGNPLGALVLLGSFVPAVVGLGSLLGWWLAERERVLQVVLFTSLPLAFLAGFSWPAEGLPALLEWLRWLSPSTAAIQASLRLNQVGAPLVAAIGPIAVLASIALLSWLAMWALGSGPAAAVSAAPTPPPRPATATAPADR